MRIVHITLVAKIMRNDDRRDVLFAGMTAHPQRSRPTVSGNDECNITG
jgi:hypothetical protein